MAFAVVPVTLNLLAAAILAKFSQRGVARRGILKS